MNASVDPLDRLLDRADPVRPSELGSAEVQQSITAMLASARQRADLYQPTVEGSASPVVSLDGRRRLGRRASRAAVVTAVVLAAGTGVAAASGFLPLGTGVFGLQGMSENDTSELLNSTSPEAAVLLRGYVAALTMAPGTPRRARSSSSPQVRTRSCRTPASRGWPWRGAAALGS